MKLPLIYFSCLLKSRIQNLAVFQNLCYKTVIHHLLCLFSHSICCNVASLSRAVKELVMAMRLVTVLARFTSQCPLSSTLLRVKGYGGVGYKLQDLQQSDVMVVAPEKSPK